MGAETPGGGHQNPKDEKTLMMALKANRGQNGGPKNPHASKKRKK